MKGRCDLLKISEEEIKSMPYITETENIVDKPIYMKFFLPGTDWRWYVVEGEAESNGDVLFFGFVQGIYDEWGYFSLSELNDAYTPTGISVERDLYFKNKYINKDNIICEKEQ